PATRLAKLPLRDHLRHATLAPLARILGWPVGGRTGRRNRLHDGRLRSRDSRPKAARRRLRRRAHHTRSDGDHLWRNAGLPDPDPDRLVAAANRACAENPGRAGSGWLGVATDGGGCLSVGSTRPLRGAGPAVRSLAVAG